MSNLVTLTPSLLLLLHSLSREREVLTASSKQNFSAKEIKMTELSSSDVKEGAQWGLPEWPFLLFEHKVGLHVTRIVIPERHFINKYKTSTLSPLI